MASPGIHDPWKKRATHRGRFTLIQRWRLNRINRLRPPFPNNQDDVVPLMFILPPDPEQCESSINVLSEWYAGHPRRFMVLYVPDFVEIPEESILQSVQILKYTNEDFSRNGSPKQVLRSSGSLVSSRITILFSSEVYAESEFLFALIPSKIRAGFWNRIRKDHAQFLVRPKVDTDESHKLVLLLEYLETFLSDNAD